MDYSPILAPIVALVAWTLVMLVWLAIARRRAFAAIQRDVQPMCG